MSPTVVNQQVEARRLVKNSSRSWGIFYACDANAEKHFPTKPPSLRRDSYPTNMSCVAGKDNANLMPGV